MDLLASLYPWIKALHIVAVIAWMAGMLYLPRLYVYHCETEPGSPESERFKTMERRLLKGIVNPAMGAVWILGILLVVILQAWGDGWMHAKFALVLVMQAVHGMYVRWQRDFAGDANRHSQKFYKWMNEAPAVLILGIVILVVVKPF
ncbi:MAG: protoporphyrinogen oxidase HemJ [Rhodovibrionaceae bacterium]